MIRYSVSTEKHSEHVDHSIGHTYFYHFAHTDSGIISEKISWNFRLKGRKIVKTRI